MQGVGLDKSNVHGFSMPSRFAFDGENILM